MDLALDPGLLKAARATLRFRTQAFIDGKYAVGHLPEQVGRGQDFRA